MENEAGNDVRRVAIVPYIVKQEIFSSRASTTPVDNKTKIETTNLKPQRFCHKLSKSWFSSPNKTRRSHKFTFDGRWLHNERKIIIAKEHFSACLEKWFTHRTAQQLYQSIKYQWCSWINGLMRGKTTFFISWMEDLNNIVLVFDAHHSKCEVGEPITLKETQVMVT